jgi:hypothetical protein
MQWERDIVNRDYALALGNTWGGIAIAFTTPLNAFGPAVIMKVGVHWMCDNCGSANLNVLLCFDVFPSSGYVRAARRPDYEVIHATGGTAIICPACGQWGSCPDLLPVPVARGTWGGIKALCR